MSNYTSILGFQSIDVNTLRPRQNGRHSADDIFKCNENVWIPIRISLKFVPQGPNNNIPALIQIMAWRRPGDKPLSGPMMVRLPTHIWVTRRQWVKGIQGALLNISFIIYACFSVWPMMYDSAPGTYNVWLIRYASGFVVIHFVDHIIISWYIRLIYLSISIRIGSLALRKYMYYDCLDTVE